jgi:hypothetical protein
LDAIDNVVESFLVLKVLSVEVGAMRQISDICTIKGIYTIVEIASVCRLHLDT